MGPELGVIELVHWVTYIFPSLSEFMKIITPLAVLSISVIGIFSNILPEPGHIYPVPSIDDLDIELKGNGRIVYRLTRISRFITLRINAIVRSRGYRWFHKTTIFCSNMINWLRGQGSKSDLVDITKPKPYRPKFLRPSNDDKHEGA